MKQVIFIGILLLCLSNITTGIHLRHESTEQRKQITQEESKQYAEFVNKLREDLKQNGYKNKLIDSINKEQPAFKLEDSPKDLNRDNISSPWDSKRLEKLGLISKLVPIEVGKLQPTQNEIGLQNSLDWAITQYDATQYFGKGPKMIGAPILTYDNQYVLDGHHRWSQLYMLNPKAEILAFNIQKVDGIKPVKMLKILQNTLGAYLGKIPEASGDGAINVFKEEEKIKAYLNCRFRPNKDDFSQCSTVDIPKTTEGASEDKKKCIECENDKHKFVDDSFINSYIKESNLAVKGNDKRKAVETKIFENIKEFVKTMKAKNAKIDDNPKRIDMPQTDGPKGLHMDEINDQRGLIKDGSTIYTLPAILLRLMKTPQLSKDKLGINEKI